MGLKHTDNSDTDKLGNSFRRTLVGLKPHRHHRRRGAAGFRRTLVGLKRTPSRVCWLCEMGFRRTLVGLKRQRQMVTVHHVNAFQTDPRGVEASRWTMSSPANPGFRRTLVGLKRPGGRMGRSHRRLFQTDPRGVEATVSDAVHSVGGSFQTDPRGVEARRREY